MKELPGISGSSFILIQIDHIHIFALVEKYKAIADPGLRRIGKSIQNGHILTENRYHSAGETSFFLPGEAGDKRVDRADKYNNILKDFFCQYFKES